MAKAFRLQRILHLEEQITNLRRYELEVLRSRLAALEEERARVWAARERRAADEAIVAGAGGLDVESFRLGRAYDRALLGTEGEVRARAAETRVQVDVKRRELADQRRDEEKLKRLEEIHRERVSEEERRVAYRLLDELAIQRHLRMRRGRTHG